MCSEEIKEDKDPDLWPIETEWLHNVFFEIVIFSRNLKKTFLKVFLQLSE